MTRSERRRSVRCGRVAGAGSRLCSLLAAHCSLPIAHCSLPIAHCLLLTAHCSLLTAHCPLLTAHCSLLTAHCSLLTALTSVHGSKEKRLELLEKGAVPVVVRPPLRWCYPTHCVQVGLLCDPVEICREHAAATVENMCFGNSDTAVGATVLCSCKSCGCLSDDLHSSRGSIGPDCNDGSKLHQ